MGLATVSVHYHDRDCGGVYYEAIIELSAVIFFAASYIIFATYVSIPNAAETASGPSNTIDSTVKPDFSNDSFKPGAISNC